MHIKRYFGMIPKKRPEATLTAFLDGNQRNYLISITL